MRRSRKVFVLLCALISACSFIADFDRSRIKDNAGGPDGSVDGGDGDMDASMDASMDAAVDAHAPDAGPDAEPPPECVNHDDCAADELCCDNECVKTSFESRCESCGAGCNGELSAACVNRTCVCEPGSGQACSGTGDERYCETAQDDKDPVCVECRGDSDCPSGRPQCVAGLCEQCDPSEGNAGCMNPNPICDASTKTCQPCGAGLACPGDLTCVNGGCYGCNPANNAGCDPNSTTPICRAAGNGQNECVGCHVAGSGDAACQSFSNRKQCLPTGACAECDTAGNAGCVANSNKPFCNAADNTCRGCVPQDCAGNPTRPFCQTSTSAATAGQCVGCRDHDDCTNAATPYCNPTSGVCQSCQNAGANAAARNAWCEQTTGGMLPVCSASGACVQCVANTANSPYCAALAPTRPHCGPAATCVACFNDGQCDNGSTTPLCNEGTGTCVPCTMGGGDAACSADSGGALPVCAFSGACVECSATNTGACTANQVCLAGGNTCVACNVDSDCKSDAAPLCHNNQCVPCDAITPLADADQRCGANRVCVTAAGAAKGQCRPCDPAGDRGCGGQPLDQCSPDTFTCVDCVGSDGCTDGNVCKAGGSTCVACNVSTDCPGTDVCTSDNTCVQCLEHMDCADTPNTPFCSSNTCVQCINDAHCTDPPNATCESNVCVPCTGDDC